MRRPTVPARYKTHRKPRGCARILCGRETRPGHFDCGGELGRVYDLQRAKDADPNDPRSYLLRFVGPDGARGAATIGGKVLSVGLSGLETGTVTDIGDGSIRIWVAWHGAGYRRHDD